MADITWTHWSTIDELRRILKGSGVTTLMLLEVERPFLEKKIFRPTINAGLLN